MESLEEYLIPTIGWYARHEGVRIPTKRDEDAGYDIYADLKTYLILPPHESYMFPTGLSVILPHDYYLELWERGSTGKFSLSRRCGVVDTGYRGEIFVCLTNCQDHAIVFNATPEEQEKLQNGDMEFYPYGKAIIQGILKKKCAAKTKTYTTEEFNALSPTERGEGKTGSSGK